MRIDAFSAISERDPRRMEGVGEVWLVDDVAEVVLVYRRSAPDHPTFDVALELGTGDVLSSPALPGFELELERLFGAVRRR